MFNSLVLRDRYRDGNGYNEYLYKLNDKDFWKEWRISTNIRRVLVEQLTKTYQARTFQYNKNANYTIDNIARFYYWDNTQAFTQFYKDKSISDVLKRVYIDKCIYTRCVQNKILHLNWIYKGRPIV